MALRLLRLPPDLISKCRDFAEAVVRSYKDGNNNNSLSVSTHGAEHNVDLWTEAKMAECIFALECNLNPHKDVGWEMRPDHYDVMVGETRVDVKSGQMHDRYLCWPIGKNHLFHQKQFDVLVFTKVDLFAASGVSMGWISKQDFLHNRLVAGEGHKLMMGTRYIEQEKLSPIFTLPSGPREIFMHYCEVCGKWGNFGYGVDIRAGHDGVWFCYAHRPTEG